MRQKLEHRYGSESIKKHGTVFQFSFFQLCGLLSASDHAWKWNTHFLWRKSLCSPIPGEFTFTSPAPALERNTLDHYSCFLDISFPSSWNWLALGQFLVSRTGIPPSVDSGDAHIVYIPSTLGGWFLLPKCSCWSSLPHSHWRSLGCILWPLWSQAIVFTVCFGAWLWVPGGQTPS